VQGTLERTPMSKHWFWHADSTLVVRLSVRPIHNSGQLWGCTLERAASILRKTVRVSHDFHPKNPFLIPQSPKYVYKLVYRSYMQWRKQNNILTYTKQHNPSYSHNYHNLTLEHNYPSKIKLTYILLKEFPTLTLV